MTRPYVRHGLSYTREYVCWHDMMNRCYKPNTIGWENYGARGIKVDPDWHDFLNFYRDMGKKPTRKHTIERIDNSKGYSKDNCCWATRKEQANNRGKPYG